MVSVFGEVVAIIYIAWYAHWSSDRLYVAKAVAVGLVVFSLVTAYSVLVETGTLSQPREQFNSVLGYLADTVNFVLYLSPLEKVKSVLITKSAESIPVLMSAMICTNCFLWFLTGVVDDDLFILVPNAVGTVLSASQVALFFVYRPRPRLVPESGEHPAKIDAEVDLEVGESSSLRSPVNLAFQPLVSPLLVIKTV